MEQSPFPEADSRTASQHSVNCMEPRDPLQDSAELS
jgi:hypothetical protein